MAIGLATVLKTVATSMLGDRLKRVVSDKVVDIARDKLNLPPEADEAVIDQAMKDNPGAAAEIYDAAYSYLAEQERTNQIAIQEQGESDRVAMQSESAYVRNARPSMIYLGGLSCFGIIVLGGAIAWTAPAQLPAFADLITALSMPLGLLLASGGIYGIRRTTDKAIKQGVDLPPLINFGK